MKKLFTRKKKDSYTPLQTKRLAKTTFVLGIALTIAIYQFAVPRIIEGYNVLADMVNPEVTYYAEAKEPVEESKEKLEVYYEEEKAALTPQYEKALDNKARSNAIERVQAELEEEKEQLRADELQTGVSLQ